MHHNTNKRSLIYGKSRGYYCGGVKWSAPENSPDLAHAEHILAVRAGFGQ